MVLREQKMILALQIKSWILKCF